MEIAKTLAGPNVLAWVCEYRSGEVFVSLAQNPLSDHDVRYAWRLFTVEQRDQAVAAERERWIEACQQQYALAIARNRGHTADAVLCIKQANGA